MSLLWLICTSMIWTILIGCSQIATNQRGLRESKARKTEKLVWKSVCEWDFPVNLVLFQIMTTAPSKCAVWRTFFTNRTILLKAAHGGYLASMLVRQQFIAQLQLVQSKPPIIWHQNHICHMAMCLVSIVVFYCLFGMLCPCGYDRVDKFPWLFCCFKFWFTISKS